jgi:hypothetical protein
MRADMDYRMDANLRTKLSHYFEFSIKHVNTILFVSQMFMNLLHNESKYSHDGK